MEIFLDYLIVFLIGGFICMIGEVLIITTNLTPARILVSFVIFGVFLEAIGVFDYISSFAKAGINVPIIGFGASLTKGVISAVESQGLLGVFTGSLTSTSGGIVAAIIFGFLFALMCHSRTKK